MTIFKLTTLVSIFTLLAAVSTPPAKSQPARATSKIDKKKIAEQVKAEFLHAWRGYEQYAWGHDDLQPQ